MGSAVRWRPVCLAVIACTCLLAPSWWIGGVDGFLRHSTNCLSATPRRQWTNVTVVRATTEEDPPDDNANNKSNDDKEIAKKLEMERSESIAKYIDPLAAAGAPVLNQRALSEMFGEPYTPEKASQRQERSERLMQDGPPLVSPTDSLPYFVNLMNPKNPLGDQPQPVDQNGLDGADGTVLAPATSESKHAELVPDSTTGLDKMEQNNEAEQEPDEDQGNAANKLPEDWRKAVLFRDPQQKLLEEDENEVFQGDPLDPYFEAAARQPDSDDDQNEDDENSDVEEQNRQAWYRDKPMNQLYPVDMADGWSILPCGRIYKHMLRPSDLPLEKRRQPGPESYVSFGFKFMDAFTGAILLEASDTQHDGVISQLKDLGPGLQKMLSSMKAGDQAEFICHAVELDIADLQEEGLRDLGWIRSWIYLVSLHERGEKWWHLSPIEASRYPTAQPENSHVTKMERLNLQTAELKKQIETELTNNPCSPLWEDVLPKLSTDQKASVVEHFDRKLELQEKRKCAEYSGSRGFGEAIKSTGQLKGYDVGRISGGCGAFYTWHETPFIFYIAIPVVPGVRAQHVKFELQPDHLTLSVGNKLIMDDDLTGQVETDIATSWAMSEKAMEYEPLPEGHPDLNDPVLKVDRHDKYHKMTKEPCIIIALKKQGKVMGEWGNPFVNV